MNKVSNKLKVILSSLGIIISVLILILPCFVKGAANIPVPTKLKYVNDYVGVVDEESKDYIVSLGSELENKTGSQTVIVVVNSLEGKGIESYSNELFRNWGIGQKGKDNGLLIFLSINDKKWRVEVGRGLEGVITDIYSSRVMNSEAVPLFKEGKYGEGLKNAYSIFATDIAKEYNISLQGSNKITQKKKSVSINPLIIYYILGAFALDVLFNKARITKFLFYLMFWNSFGGGPRGGSGGFGGGNQGGFGGGSSSGGGSSGSW
ncbi:TPM domain-containing protein [Clostridium drakei]|uniref:Beta-propeller domain-containing protein, methanol dehydrogenase n=1 Tax=Clostridium drakei TaxID=332101 RepID=A0A2U8DPQ2_9CLOT|nr:TPM domain-containing protein [Clostridium drakei]AWI04767.1 beta-propeller domain-containing protein, methanol dehydrogenase [Clostridium drakei]